MPQIKLNKKDKTLLVINTVFKLHSSLITLCKAKLPLIQVSSGTITELKLNDIHEVPGVTPYLK